MKTSNSREKIPDLVSRVQSNPQLDMEVINEDDRLNNHRRTKTSRAEAILPSEFSHKNSARLAAMKIVDSIENLELYKRRGNSSIAVKEDSLQHRRTV